MHSARNNDASFISATSLFGRDALNLTVKYFTILFCCSSCLLLNQGIWLILYPLINLLKHLPLRHPLPHLAFFTYSYDLSLRLPLRLTQRSFISPLPFCLFAYVWGADNGGDIGHYSWVASRVTWEMPHLLTPLSIRIADKILDWKEKFFWGKYAENYWLWRSFSGERNLVGGGGEESLIFFFNKTTKFYKTRLTHKRILTNIKMVNLPPSLTASGNGNTHSKITQQLRDNQQFNGFISSPNKLWVFHM